MPGLHPRTLPNFLPAQKIGAKGAHAIAPAPQVPGAEKMNAGRTKSRWSSVTLLVYVGVNPFDPGAVA